MVQLMLRWYQFLSDSILTDAAIVITPLVTRLDYLDCLCSFCVFLFIGTGVIFRDKDVAPEVRHHT